MPVSLFHDYLPSALLAPWPCPMLMAGPNYREVSCREEDWFHREDWVRSDKDKLEILVDVHHFAQSEISVKTKDGEIIVEAKHGERREENCCASRSFVRKYKLPKDHDAMDVISYLSSDGAVLKIVAPERLYGGDGKEITVPIQLDTSIGVKNE